MSEFKNGDLVVDYEGDLTLIVSDGNGNLIPICLYNKVTGPCYYSDLHPTIVEFEKAHKDLGRPIVFMGNIKDNMRKLREELSK